MSVYPSPAINVYPPLASLKFSTDYYDNLYAQPNLTANYYDFRVGYDADYKTAGQETTYASKTINVPPGSTVFASAVTFVAGATGSVELRLYIAGVKVASKVLGEGVKDSVELVGVLENLSGPVTIELKGYAVDGGTKRVSYRNYLAIAYASIG